jgi:hypothetical protein
VTKAVSDSQQQRSDEFLSAVDASSSEGSIMLVLSRKSQESVVVARGDDGVHRLLKVTVLAVHGETVKPRFVVRSEPATETADTAPQIFRQPVM